MERKDRKNKANGMTVLKRVLIGLLATIVLLVGGIVFYFYNMLNKMETTEVKKENLGIVKEETGKDITNIALFGVDQPKGQRGRSDSIMILSLDKEHKKVKLTSFMRDSYVNIPGHGMDKMNHAYGFGGPELAIRTLNTNFGLNIENFATVNFTSLPKIVDKLGGIEVEITNGDLKYIGHGITKTGIQTLNGEQALSYSRIRYDGGDQRRTERQRTVVEALLKKFKGMPVTSIPGVLTELLPYVETSYSLSGMLSLATDNMGLLQSEMIQKRYPEDGKYQGKTINRVYYTVFDIEGTKRDLQEFIYEKKNS